MGDPEENVNVFGGEILGQCEKSSNKHVCNIERLPRQSFLNLRTRLSNCIEVDGGIFEHSFQL